MLKFIGKEGIVFEGTRMTKKVTNGFVSQDKTVLPVMKIIDGIPHIGALIFEDKNDTDYQGGFLVVPGTDEFDLVSAFRTLMLVELEPELESNQLVINAHALSLMHETTLRHVIDRVSVRDFKRISTEMPPNLGEAIVFLKENGIEINKSVLTLEVRLGNQVYNQVLRDAGVESPADFDERKRLKEEQLKESARRREAAVEPYVPVLQAYLNTLGHEPGCKCINAFKFVAAEALERGITEPGLVVGLAGIRIASVLTSLEGGLINALLTTLQQTFEDEIEENPQLVQEVAMKVVMIIENQKPKQQRKDAQYYYNTLSDLQRRWDTLPVNNL